MLFVETANSIKTIVNLIVAQCQNFNNELNKSKRKINDDLL